MKVQLTIMSDENVTVRLIPDTYSEKLICQRIVEGLELGDIITHYKQYQSGLPKNIRDIMLCFNPKSE